MVLSSPITGTLTRDQVRGLVYDELINHSGIDDNKAEDLKKLGDQVVIGSGFGLETDDVGSIVEDLEISLETSAGDINLNSILTVGDLTNVFICALLKEERIEE